MSTFKFEDFQEVKNYPNKKVGKSASFQFKDFEEVNVPSARSTTGLRGISEDIKQSLKGAPTAIVEALAALPSEAYESGKQVVTHPIRATENVLAGLLQGLKGAINIPSVLTQYAGKKDIGVPGIPHYFRDIASPLARKLEIGDTGLQKRVLGEPQEGDPLLQGIGEFAPYARVGRAAKGLSGLAKRSASAGAFGVGQKQDPLQSALLGLVGEGASKAIGNVEKLRPSRLIKSPLSAEELEKALNITKGTETGLGEVIENPFLQQQYQNILTKIPFSGANQAMQRTAAEITKQGDGLIDELLNDKSPNAASNIGENIMNALKEAKAEAQKQKRANFQQTNERADKIGLKIGRDNFSMVAQETLEDMKKSPELIRETDAQLLKDLQTYADSNVSNNLKLTNIFKSKLGDKASQAFKEGDNYKYSLYRNLKDALDKDVQQSIENSGDDSLKKNHASDMKFYKENIAPFEDREIMKYTNKGGDPDTITNAFLKISNVSDRSNLLKKVQEKLPADKKHLFASAYFMRALDDGQLNPLKMRTLYNRLGENQRKALLPDKELRNKLKDYSSLVSKNTDPLTAMFNPKTGQRGLSEIAHFATTLPALVAAAFTGSIPIGVATSLALPIVARGATNYLTSPIRREKLINKMIRNKTRPLEIDSSRINEYLRNALQGVASSQNTTDN